MKTDRTDNQRVVESCNGYYLWEDSLYYVISSEAVKGKEKITIHRVIGDGTESSETTTLDDVYIWLLMSFGCNTQQVRRCSG